MLDKLDLAFALVDNRNSNLAEGEVGGRILLIIDLHMSPGTETYSTHQLDLPRFYLRLCSLCGEQMIDK